VVLKHRGRPHRAPGKVRTYRGTFPLSKSPGFIRENARAVRHTPYRHLVLIVLMLRIPLNLIFDAVACVVDIYG
jgi:hypothetical protein